MFQCKPCGKMFTGQCNYDQHIESIKHKKKVSQVNFFNCHNVPSMDTSLSNPTANPSRGIPCSTCGTTFDTVENFTKHAESPEHAQKVMEKAAGKTNDNTVSTSTDSAKTNGAKQSTEMMNGDEDELLVPSFNAEKLFYSRCEACDKAFTGPEPYKQHMQSSEHQRKIAIQSSETNLNMSSLSCDICKKFFSGPAPYMQHMNSEIHKKKQQQFELMQSFSSKKEETDTGKEGFEITNQWFCKICNKQCSGLIPYQQHLEGAAHFKNLKKAELLNSIMKTGETANHGKQENDSHTVSQDSQLENGDSSQKSPQKMEEDYIFPETGSRLEVISTAELKKLVTVVSPDENIDFDKLEKEKATEVVADESAVQGNLDPDQEKNDKPHDQNIVSVVPEQETGIEVEEKSVLQVCELCDVMLYDKDEVMQHYESQGHFKRKWNSD